MKTQTTRRDFLKLTGALPVGFVTSQLLRKAGLNPLYQQGQKKNILVIVFDAFSAYNIPFYGYQRETTPNISKLAQRAIVYHNHYAGGNFTTPGTASLLTGVLPWTHRAFNPGGIVSDSFVSQNIFSAFPNHYRIAYTHNGWANILLEQFGEHITELIQREDLLLSSPDTLIPSMFKNDEDIATVSWIRAMKKKEEGHAYSLFLSQWFEQLEENRIKNLKPIYPRGLPSSAGSDFLLETSVDRIMERLKAIEQPFLGYFHFLPPHDPYHTHHDFYNYFLDDKYTPIEKPIDIFAKRVFHNLPQKRREYDEFILYCDREFARLYSFLESSGLLEDTWLILTSDHGELNERGISGHSTDALYQPVVRIPLLIFEPDRETGVNIYQNTSAIDVLPTLTRLTGQEQPNWAEGGILPPFASDGNVQKRNIYVIRANDNAKYEPFTVASTMLVRDDYKLLYYFGYKEIPGDGLVKLFDVRSDPEEMNNLYASKKGTADELLNELKKKLSEVNEPYL